MAINDFKQIFGYSPLEEFINTPAWRKERRAGLSPLVDAQIGYMGQMETNKANAQLAQAQNDFNLVMWNKQNEYNSPKATMERLVDAGINPRAYQQIGTFANASQPHKAERPDFESPLGKLAKFNEQAQIKLAYKQLKLENINKTADILSAIARLAEERYQYRTTMRNRRFEFSTEQARKNSEFTTSLQQRQHEFQSLESLRGYQSDLYKANATRAFNEILTLVQSREIQRDEHDLRLAMRGIKRNSDGSLVIPDDVYGILNRKDMADVVYLYSKMEVEKGHLTNEGRRLSEEERHNKESENIQKEGQKIQQGQLGLSISQFQNHKKEFELEFLRNMMSDYNRSNIYYSNQIQDMIDYYRKKYKEF